MVLDVFCPSLTIFRYTPLVESEVCSVHFIAAFSSGKSYDPFTVSFVVSSNLSYGASKSNPVTALL